MRVTVRFYAELNDFLPPARRFRRLVRELHVGPAVKDLIESFGVPHTEVELVVVDGEPVDFSYRVRDGDEIAVYPVFESLDVSRVARLRERPLRRVRFVADNHLAALVRLLRLLGFDTVHDPSADDARLAGISAEERRVLLTRDVGLLKRSAVTHGYYVRSTDPRRQAVEVLRRFDLSGSMAPFTRCLVCNGELRVARLGEVEGRVPPGAARDRTDFTVCEGCGRVYWKGSHFDRLRGVVESVRAELRSEGVGG